MGVLETLEGLRAEAAVTADAIRTVEELDKLNTNQDERISDLVNEQDRLLAVIVDARTALGAEEGTSIVGAATRLKAERDDQARIADARSAQIMENGASLVAVANRMKIPLTATAGRQLVRDLAEGCERYITLADAVRGGGPEAIIRALEAIDSNAPTTPAEPAPPPEPEPAPPEPDLPTGGPVPPLHEDPE